MRDSRLERRAGDGWITCAHGHEHWGLEGAAGLLLIAGPAQPGEAHRVLLQHRALWSHHGGLWALAGGARDLGESALAGALREAGEEAGVPRDGIRVRQAWIDDHDTWTYTTVLADAIEPLTARATDSESIEVRWVPVEEVSGYPLLPAFATMWERIRPVLFRQLAIVVDVANVMGSRPDGWWRDREGAARRLRDEIGVMAAEGVPAGRLGLPGHRWWPRLIMVTEGAARPVSPTAGVEVVAASGEGDDTIVDVVRQLTAQPHLIVFVVTADRELATRVERLGSQVMGPRTLLSMAAEYHD